MRFRAIQSGVLTTALALGPASCAGTVASPDPFFAAAVAPDVGAARAAAAATDRAATGPAAAFAVEIALARADGTRTVVPRAICSPGQSRVIAQADEIAYVVDYDTDFGATMPRRPVEAVVRDGIDLAVCPQSDDAGALSLGYRISVWTMARPVPVFTTTLAAGPPVSIALPTVERALCEGTSRLTADVETELARLPDPAGRGQVRVLARVTPILLERRVHDPGPASHEIDPPGGPATGRVVRLRVAPVRVALDADPGTVLHDVAIAVAPAAAAVDAWRALELSSCLDGRVRLASAVDGFPSARSLVVHGDDSGALHLTLNTGASARTVTVTPTPEPQFVALARVVDGGALGAVVSAVPEPVPSTLAESQFGGYGFADRWLRLLRAARVR